MQLSVLQEDLLKALTNVSRFVSPRAQLPVLTNILFSAKKGKLRLAATNLEMGISLQIGAKTEEEGEMTVPAKMAVELMSNMPAGKIKISAEGGHLKFSAGAFEGSLAGIPASEFPSVPAEAKNEAFSLPRDLLGSLSSKVSFASSTDEARPVLTGILLLFADNLTAVATDGFRLSYKEFKLGKKEKKEERLLVPARAIDELAKILGEEEGVKISFLEKEGQILFSGNSVVITGRLLEGDFPSFEKIMPQTEKHIIVVDKEELLRAVKAAAVFAKEAASIIRLEVGKGKLVVKAESQQYGREEVSVDAKVEGDNLEVAFNYRYLLDFLGSVDGEEVSFATDGPTSPGLFQDTKDPSYRHLIMPVRTQS